MSAAEHGLRTVEREIWPTMGKNRIDVCSMRLRRFKKGVARKRLEHCEYGLKENG